MGHKQVKTIDVRKIFRNINKRMKEKGDILLVIDGEERKGMSYMGIRGGKCPKECKKINDSDKNRKTK